MMSLFPRRRHAPAADPAAPSTSSRPSTPHAPAIPRAAIAGTACALGLLGLALAGEARPGARPTAAAPVAPSPRAAADALDFGGAEIDDSAALKRNFGASSDQVKQVAVGDMNGDGHLDLVVGKVEQDAVYLNDGQGNFDAAASELPFNGDGGTEPDHFALGDLDGDGDLDAVGWWRGPSDRDNYVFVNDGTGQLGEGVGIGGGNSTVNDVAIADFNGDGALDLAMVRSIGGTAEDTVMLNQNTGDSPPSFEPGQIVGPVPDAGRAVAAGDVDGDGDVDLVVANGEDGIGEVTRAYLNDGDGGFYSGNGTCNPQWAWGVPTSGPGAAHSGTQLWATNLEGDYANDQNVSITSPAIDLSGAGAGTIELSWWQWVAYHSGAQVDILSTAVSKDGGTSWETVYALGAQGAWEEHTITLGSEYAVADFRIQFHLSSDDSGTAAGFYVDDVAVKVDGTPVFSTDFEADDGGFTSSLPLFPTDEVRCVAETGHYSTAVVLGDMNGDGHLDIVLGNQSRRSNPANPASSLIDGEERIYLNDGEGHFDDPASEIVFGAAVDTTWRLALGDLDGDGQLDVVTAEPGGQSRVWYNGGGAVPSFTTSDVVGTDGAPTYGIALADLDGDGALDVAAGLDGQQSRVFLSPGALGFLASPSSTVGETMEMTEALALGDVDRDGDLDLVVGNSPPFDFVDGSFDPRSRLHLNNGSGGFFGAYPAFAIGEGEVRAVAVADVTGDGALEVLFGILGGQSMFVQPVFDPGGGLMFFEGGCPSTCFGSDGAATRALATGDVDRDGDLDIVAGNVGADAVYFNNGGLAPTGPFGEGDTASFGGDNTTAVALGDIDGDGDLDAVLGNTGARSVAYLNDGTGDFGAAGAGLPFGSASDTRSIALADVDGDGALDVVAGNHEQQNVIYLGDGNGGFGDAAGTIDFGTGSDATLAVAAGDLNGDGAPDLVVANEVEANVVYLSDRASPPAFVRERSFGHGDDHSTSLALGDVNGDGTLDVVVGNQPDDIRDVTNIPNPVHQYAREVFLNRHRRPERLPDGLPWVRIDRPGATANGQGLSVAEVQEEERVDIDFTLFDREGDTVGLVRGWYSLNGGGSWLPAKPWNPNLVLNLAASPGGTPHTFQWDTDGSGFFGQSDEVIIRLEALPQRKAATPGSYGYPDAVAGPRQWPFGTAATYPFRARGTQVRVFSEDFEPGSEAAGARVYRLPSGQDEGAFALSNAAGEPLVTDAEGYLRGHAEVRFGDRLFALWPVSVTEHYTLYHMSGEITNDGLDEGELEGVGVVPLVVSAGKPLMLFNLDISLEWDARYDSAFMLQLEEDIRRASEVLWDVTNAQVALGPVRIHHAKQEWLAADVIVHAANNLRPAAAMGGVVDDPLDDVDKHGRVIEDAYVPGQIQMGPAWGRFGDPATDLGDDWPRALAHELGHYFLFQMDNYLGVVGGRLVPNDCKGSFMTDAYIDEYSEMIARDQWTGACLDTLAESTTGRTDWETILNFYPWLNTDNVNLPGPNRLTLDVTEITEENPGTAVSALDTPFYSLREGGERLFVGAGGGHGYVFKHQKTEALTDDYVVAVGSPVGDQMHARGAEPGDRLCVIDRQRSPTRIGCTTVGEFEGSLEMAPVPGWRPQIEVSPVATDTLAITVTQQIGDHLFAQVLPTTGLSTTFPITSTVAELLSVPGLPDTYAAQVQLPYPVFNAFVRVWEPDVVPTREAMTQFVLGDGWGPNRRQWGPNRRQWGPNRRQWGPNRRQWGAPVSSGDGQVSVYNVTDIFSDTGTSALQSLTTLPPIPAWLRPVGNVVRFEASGDFPRTIAFNYLQQEVPGSQVYEEGLRIYHSTDKGTSWQQLETVLDAQENLATAIMPSDGSGNGLYMLSVTIAMPALEPGWNQIGYPVTGTRSVTEALGAIAGDYRLIYDNGPTAAGPWRLHDQDVMAEHPDLAGFVNDLGELVFGGVYWIYMLDAAEPFFGLPELPGDAAPEGLTALEALSGPDAADEMPPATHYGWVTASPGFTPAAGMPVVGTVGGVVCGQTTVQDWAGQLAYKLQVSAASDTEPGCGQAGDTVVFSVDDQIMVEAAAWDNTMTHYVPLGTLATGADLAIEQTVLPDPPQSSNPYAYLVTVHNHGPLPATEVVLRGVRPPGATVTFGADEQRYCTVAGGDIVCDLGAIPAHGSRTLVLVLSAPAPGSVTNTLSVTAFEPDPDDADNTSRLTHDVVASILGNPTAVSLTGFNAVLRPDGRHEITWSTGSESDIMGFLVRRAPAPQGPYTRITPALIPARGTVTMGARYRYIAPATDGSPAYYRLETVALADLPDLFGPIPLRTAATRAFLPALRQR